MKQNLIRPGKSGTTHIPMRNVRDVTLLMRLQSQFCSRRRIHPRMLQVTLTKEKQGALWKGKKMLQQRVHATAKSRRTVQSCAWLPHHLSSSPRNKWVQLMPRFIFLPHFWRHGGAFANVIRPIRARLPSILYREVSLNWIERYYFYARPIKYL